MQRQLYRGIINEERSKEADADIGKTAQRGKRRKANGKTENQYRSPRGYSRHFQFFATILVVNPRARGWQHCLVQIEESEGDWGIQNTSQLFSFWNIYNTCLSLFLYCFCLPGVSYNCVSRKIDFLDIADYLFPPYIFFNRYYRFSVFFYFFIVFDTHVFELVKLV